MDFHNTIHDNRISNTLSSSITKADTYAHMFRLVAKWKLSILGLFPQKLSSFLEFVFIHLGPALLERATHVSNDLSKPAI